MRLLPKGPTLQFSVVFLLCTLFATPGYADTLNIRNDTRVIFTDLSGPGKSSSSLTEGVRHFSTLGIKTRGKTARYNYSLDLGFKATNDKRRDTEKFSLTNLRGRISNHFHTVNMGDTYESFSKYALNTSIKGVSYHYRNNENMVPEITLLGGIAYSRWDNFWGTDATERKLYGARIRQELTPELWLAASLVKINDSQRNFGSSLYDGDTLSFDMEYKPLDGLTIVAESSFSHIEEDNLASETIKHSGQAYRIEAIGDQNPSRVTIEYERVSPDFLSIAGSATADREKVKTRWRYKYTKRITVTSAFLWYRDDLKGQLAVRTQHYKPEITLALRRMFQRRYAIGSLSYKYDRSYSPTISTKNHFISGSYRDRFGIFYSTTNLGVTFYETDGVRENNEFIANTSLSTRITKGLFIWKPSINLGTWRSDNELVAETDRTYEYSLGLGCDIPSRKVTVQFKIGQHKLYKDSADNSEKFFSNLNAYYRPRLFAGLKNSTFYLRGLANNYSYTTDSRDFTESRITAGFSIRF